MKRPKITHFRFLASLPAFAIASAGLIFSGSAQAAVLATYEFTGGVLSSTTSSPGQYSTSDVSKGAGFGAGAAGDATNGVYRIGGDAGSGSTLTAALANNEFISFKITPAAGLGVQLQNLTLTQYFVSAAGAGTGTFNLGIALFSSVDGFASATNVIAGSNFENTTTFSLAATGRNIDLSSLGTITTETEFRLYVYDNSGATSRAHRIDDLVLNGSVVVPEASSALSLGLAGLVVVSRRRRTA